MRTVSGNRSTKIDWAGWMTSCCAEHNSETARRRCASKITPDFMISTIMAAVEDVKEDSNPEVNLEFHSISCGLSTCWSSMHDMY